MLQFPEERSKQKLAQQLLKEDLPQVLEVDDLMLKAFLVGILSQQNNKVRKAAVIQGTYVDPFREPRRLLEEYHQATEPQAIKQFKEKVDQVSKYNYKLAGAYRFTPRPIRNSLIY